MIVVSLIEKARLDVSSVSAKSSKFSYSMYSLDIIFFSAFVMESDVSYHSVQIKR